MLLSVNVNKVATLRNSRGGTVPSVVEAVEVCIDAGAAGITVHPRADRRHITPDDVRDISGLLARRARDGSPNSVRRPGEVLARQARERSPGARAPQPVEFNIEGDPRPELLDLIEETRPDQCTLVPVVPGEITSQAGWRPGADIAGVVRRLKSLDVRVSLFVDAVADPIRWAASIGADRVELYTEPFARAFQLGAEAARESFDTYAAAARLAHSLGMGINAGHDLDLNNLVIFRNLPFLDEVSIGHAIVSRALFVGLKTVVREYLDVLGQARPA